MRSSRALRTLAWGVIAVGVAAPLARHRLGLRVPVVTVTAFSAPFALALAAPRTKLRDAGIFTLQMWAYYAHYDMPDDDPERLRARTRVAYPARVDKLIGGGQLPTHRLQRALGRPGEVRKLDLGLAWVHWVWFLFPQLALTYVLLFKHEHFVRSAILLAGTYDAGLVCYWSVPTAPPWYAAQTGVVGPIRRIMVEAGEHFWKRAWKNLYGGLEGNPFAAMPSLHFGTSVQAARILQTTGKTQGRIGWAYALTLGFGLVYLGEHYVIDLIGGLALAEGVRGLEPYGRPLLLRVGKMIQQLEPGAA